MNIYSVINYLRLILFPFSFIYGIFVSIRNYLYSNDILFKYNSKSKIISVGNINTGGSGKTPLVIKLAEILLDRNFKVAIISRGYRRKSKGMQVVFDTKNIVLKPEESGDEPYMISQFLMERYNNFYFIVSENRIEAIRYLEKNFSSDYIILDDAFQQLVLKKDCDFVLIDVNNFQRHKILNRILLPAGNLREPLNSLYRGTAIFQNNKYSEIDTANFLKKFNKPIFKIRYTNSGIYDKENKKIEGSINNVIAFCGIADPDSFKKSLENFKIKDFIAFPDHKNYTEKDLEYIKRNYSSGDSFITTEKDFVKIKNFDKFTETYPVYFIRLSIEIDKENELINLILNL